MAKATKTGGRSKSNTKAKRASNTKKKPAAKPKKAAKPKTYRVDIARETPRGLFAHIWEARRGLAASFKAQAEQGVREERLLAYVAFACFMAFCARVPSLLSEASALEASVPLAGLVAGTFVACVVFAPLFLYGLAGISHAVSVWAFGGQGTYPLARLALFWSLVLCVPLGLIWALIVQALTLTGLTTLINPLGLLVFPIWLWIWSSFLALAEGFGRLRTFLFMITLVACLFGVILILSG